MSKRKRHESNPFEGTDSLKRNGNDLVFDSENNSAKFVIVVEAEKEAEHLQTLFRAYLSEFFDFGITANKAIDVVLWMEDNGMTHKGRVMLDKVNLDKYRAVFADTIDNSVASRATYARGVSELVDKGLLAHGERQGEYWINPNLNAIHPSSFEIRTVYTQAGRHE